jgi:4-carboxymuconolactone decarboxylase
MQTNVTSPAGSAPGRWATVLLALSLATTAPAGAQTRSPADAQTMRISRRAERPTQAGPAATFTGAVRVAALRDATPPSRVSAAAVAFEPGARSAWHTHPLGQLLVVTAGTGRVQQWGGPVEEIREGDVVWTPPGVKHWHGAAPTTAMAHTAIQEALDGRNVAWLEQVSDAQYTSPNTRSTSRMSSDSTSAGGTPAGSASAGSTPRPGPYADIAPALDQLTQQVLFGQVWERPGLSKRDRSLITVATLVAQYRTNELPYHLRFAFQNGVTKDELTELVTHLAFYAGWPTANTAVGILRQTFAEPAK